MGNDKLRYLNNSSQEYLDNDHFNQPQAAVWVACCGHSLEMNMRILSS